MASNIILATGRRYLAEAARYLLVFAVVLHPITAHASPTPSMTANELRRLQLTRDASLIIVDVRPPAEFVKAHIQGAVNMIAAAIERANLPRDGHIIVYCSEPSCPLSASAATKLISNGYQQVALLEGGFGEWEKNSYPVQGPSNTPVVKAARSRTTTSAARAEINASALTLDVRLKSEYSAGHIPHARSLPLEQLDRDLVRLPKDHVIVVYDRSAARSRRAADKLTAAGFKVSELSGGLAGWTKRGKTLVTKE